MKQFRDEALAFRDAKAPPDAPAFVPAVLDVDPARVSSSASPSPALRDLAAIEISIGLATVRIQAAVDAKALAVVLKALKVLA